MEMFNGMRVVESVYLEQAGEPIVVKRTWRERLFSRPWLPHVRHRLVVPRVPYRGVVRLDARTIAIHPAMLHELKLSVAAKLAEAGQTGAFRAGWEAQVGSEGRKPS